MHFLQWHCWRLGKQRRTWQLHHPRLLQALQPVDDDTAKSLIISISHQIAHFTRGSPPLFRHVKLSTLRRFLKVRRIQCCQFRPVRGAAKGLETGFPRQGRRFWLGRRAGCCLPSLLHARGHNYDDLGA
jgi:hypothetical protein